MTIDCAALETLGAHGSANVTHACIIDRTSKQ